MTNEKKSPKKNQDPKNPPGGQNLVWYVALAGLLAMLLTAVVLHNSALELSYFDFQRLVEASRRDADGNLIAEPAYIVVESPTADPAAETPVKRRVFWDLRNLHNGRSQLSGTVDCLDIPAGEPLPDPAIWLEATDDEGPLEDQLHRGVTFRCNKPLASEAEESLLAKLTAYGIKFDNDPPPTIWQSYAPMLIVLGLGVLLFFYMMRRLSGAGSPMSFGRSRGRLYAQEDIDITFNDVAGIDEAVEEVKEVVDFLRSPDRYQRLGGRIPKGALLVGPPGTGKTLLARAIAGEAGVPFFSLSGSDFVEMFVGVGAARVRDMFQQAEAKAPCIIFIDELDALGKSRGGSVVGGHDEREQTLNALLVEMDGFDSNTSVIVIAATNRPETLDQALLRPGRFDRQVLVDRPDIRGREAILKVHVKHVKLNQSVDLKQVASITPGFVGADLANLVNEAALLAARKDKQSVEMSEFNEAVERVTAGLEKKQRVMDDDEKQRVAYHESGHALAALSLPNTDPVHKVSIIPRGLAALGYTLQRPEGDRFLMTQSELESRIQVLLAGTIVEEMIYADISTGAQNDLERATDIARSMVMDYGMSRLGRVSYRESGRAAFLADSMGDERLRSHSEKTAREIDEEVRRILDHAMEKIRHILETRRAALEALTQRLIEVESMDQDELQRIVADAEPHPRILPGTSETKSARVPEAPIQESHEDAPPARDSV
jgi:cell division protease FtsH